MSWIKIDEGKYARETDNPVEVVTIAQLQANLSEFNQILLENTEYVKNEDKNVERILNEERQRKVQIYTERYMETERLITKLEALG